MVLNVGTGRSFGHRPRSHNAVSPPPPPPPPPTGGTLDFSNATTDNSALIAAVGA